jgi:hypothetical protein
MPAPTLVATAEPSPVEPSAAPASPDPVAELAEPKPASAPVSAPESTDIKSPEMNFKPLQQWIESHLEQITNRSLNQWSKPEDLLRDAPANLNYTAKLLDPEAKLVIIGLEGDPRFLALALPGGNIDKRYVEWFSTPPGGVGGRVERTISPALLEAGTAGYRVVRRGVVIQD